MEHSSSLYFMSHDLNVAQHGNVRRILQSHICMFSMDTGFVFWHVDDMTAFSEQHAPSTLLACFGPPRSGVFT